MQITLKFDESIDWEQLSDLDTMDVFQLATEQLNALTFADRAVDFTVNINADGSVKTEFQAPGLSSDDWTAVVNALTNRGVAHTSAESYAFDVLKALHLELSPAACAVVRNRNVRDLLVQNNAPHFGATRATVEVDVAFLDDDDRAATLSDLSKRGLDVTIKTEVGGGGNPVMRLTGPRATVEAWLSDAGYDEPIEFYAAS